MNEQYQPYQNYTQAPPVVKNAAYYRAKARQMLKPCFWTAFLAALIASFLGGTSGGGSFNFNFDFGSSSSDIDASFGTQLQEIADLWQSGGFSAICEEYIIVPILLGVFSAVFLFGILFTLLVGAPITLGYQKYLLNVMDGKGKDLSVLFSYFKQAYGKSIALRVLHDLILSACSLPLLAVTVGMGWLNRHALLHLFMGESTTGEAVSILLMLLSILVVAILTSILQIWVQYRYTFCFMILAEYPEMSAIDALRNSASLMRCNKWRLFCLNFSFFGWILLAACCTCGIGVLFLTPYMDVANAAFYDDIANRAAARETEFPSLNPDDYVVE